MHKWISPIDVALPLALSPQEKKNNPPKTDQKKKKKLFLQSYIDTLSTHQ